MSKRIETSLVPRHLPLHGEVSIFPVVLPKHCAITSILSCMGRPSYFFAISSAFFCKSVSGVIFGGFCSCGSALGGTSSCSALVICPPCRIYPCAASASSVPCDTSPESRISVSTSICRVTCTSSRIACCRSGGICAKTGCAVSCRISCSCCKNSGTSVNPKLSQ